MAARAILVTGATGKQGGSVVDALLKANVQFEILALTRNLQSALSQQLLQKSPMIRLVSGDDATEYIFRKAKETTKVPIWGVFSVQAVTNKEEIQANSLTDLSLKNGVSHFVFSTADRGGVKSDTDPTNVPHFITKFNAEQHLFAQAKDSNTTWTVLRPVVFFENLVPGLFGKVFVASWALKLREEQKMQLIATSDIGTFAAKAFLEYESGQYKNKSISLAGDELTLAYLLNEISKEPGYMFTWMRDVGFGANVQECKAVNPDMKDFGHWLETQSSWQRH
ncbi:NAD(P)-binding protein [Plenodomus tracheiphilus IPT5]|uniref:NAD(P)-binding protein n=1 Tax=Plenodomus tracheiphilus IPT5 TaxID=1408161 RepID=A0A6A7AP79_9PLEO|nr:NAD(P)-binding protein [Plenodomus tracheiphilus IPT5]